MLATTKTCRACGRGFAGAEVFCPEDGSRLFAHTRADRTLDPLIGFTLDNRYRILRVLGEGGMGIVYEAEHTQIERRVAVKVLREDFCRRADVVERFRREARSASRIGHPNIVDVLDFGETPSGASYFVMELLTGEDLADLLARGGTLSPSRAVLIAYQCCHALGAAHDKGIVHRDLKPENIFLVEREGAADFVKIVDFGVAKISDFEFDLEHGGPGPHPKLTRTGMIFGTPEYMSPEQATGLTPDHRVDIYALGVTLYELLTGRVPFEGESFMSVLSKHASKQVPALRDVNPRVKLSPELERVVLRALTKDRDQRYTHMRQMALALQHTPEMPPLPFRLSLPSPVPVPVQLPPAPPPAGGPALATSRPPPPPAALANRLADAALFGARAPRASARGGWLAGASIAAATALAVAVYAANGRGASKPTEPAGLTLASERTQKAESLHTAAQPLARAGTQQAPDEAPGLELVTVRVTTQPPGARVRMAGGGEVCASTPCSFDAVRGAPISLQARRGPRQALATVQPTGPTQLHLVLDARDPKADVTGPGHDDLKVPEIFRQAKH